MSEAVLDAARTGDLGALADLVRRAPECLHSRMEPYGWTLLHVAAHAGQLAIIRLLLELGLDVNVREHGDNTTAMHWAAAAGHLNIVETLIEAGGDVHGTGDDHELGVIGWATCWEGSEDEAHRAIAELLIRSGARHHVFSAIALGLEHEVRNIITSDPSALMRPMSRNENFQLPLHFAVRKNKRRMVKLLLDLGADPNAPDGSNVSPIVYAASPAVDDAIVRILAKHSAPSVYGALVLGDDEAAQRRMDHATSNARGGRSAGALHLMAKQGDVDRVRWLLDRGENPNALWDADVTPLHLAAWEGNEGVVRLLLERGADANLRDTEHAGDARAWAEHAGHLHVVEIIEAHRTGS